MNRETLLLLNPPGERVYLRDYFCSKVSQADYVNHPIDLLFLSGYLSQSHRLRLIDAIVDRLPLRSCLEKAESLRPDVAVGLIGSVSYDEDIRFYRELGRRLPDLRLILIGDVLIERRAHRLALLDFAEAFLHDFSSADLSLYLRDPQASELRNMTVRRQGGVAALPLERSNGSAFRLPIPEHSLFLEKPYRYPFVRRRLFATVLTDFGCPYSCTFCIMSSLGWKRRPVGDVVQELAHLGERGVRELLFLDQTFGIPRSRACQLLEAMERLPNRLGWVCFSRPDVIDAELAARMRSAGCHTVILGLESGDQGVLDSVRKDYGTEQVRQGFRICAREGLRTVATVLIGLPQETEESFRRTIDFLKEVDPDFASFNVAVPRMGTALREEALALELVDPRTNSFDQSGQPVSMPTLALQKRRVAELRRRAVREFYGRPGYWAGRLKRWAGKGTPLLSDLRIQLHQGWHLMRNSRRS